ncbi:YbaB/EbfC family nucleoid-associated protein [uncultured Eubacterium sp.]|uniref:YbaB/EbfC family nucleoid-associated protein n=1 Tax=uncultured Eubacterium sp. TaxID=165185 RepID=UPI0015B945F6|nr:YbaB/EbfC family nucleoid-associated protein [uncultured Eubacterium sp.]
MKARIPKGMGGGPQNMQAMLKQAQKMQEDIEAKRLELEQKEYVVTSGGGMVEITMTGKHEVEAIGINPEVVDPEDVEMLEDMLVAALNEVTRQIDEEAERELNSVTGGLNIPGL